MANSTIRVASGAHGAARAAIDRLPAGGPKEKLERLWRAQDERATILGELARRQADLSNAVLVAEARARQMAEDQRRQHRQSRQAASVIPSTFVSGRSPGPVEIVGAGSGGNADPIAVLEDEIAKLRAERASITRRIEELKTQNDATARRLVDYVNSIARDIPIEIAEPVQIPAKTNLETARKEIAFRRNELATIATAPIHSTEAKARARAQIEALAQQGAPNVADLVETAGLVRFPLVQTRTFLGFEAVSGSISGHEIFNSLAFQCWLDGDTIIEKLEAEIDALSNDSAALSAEERIAARAEILSETLVWGRIEEALLELSEQRGDNVLRRPDADPRAILSLSADLPAPR